MYRIGIKEMLDAGAHFGHQTRRWNPKMKRFIFAPRNGIHIIDLQKTLYLFEEAYNFIVKLLSKGGKLLFIGTKKQAQNIIFKEAVRSNQFYVNHRWLGGTLTNFKTVKKSVNRMKKLSLMTTDGTFDKLPKKEVVSLSRNLSKLEKNLSGIEKMTKLPKAILVVDPKREAISILEAKKLNIKVIATIDTNCDPDMIDYCIPSNDDSIRSIKLFVGKLADACIEGNAKYHKFLSQKKMVNQINVDSDKDNLFSKGSLRRKSLKVDIVHRTINVNDVKENEKILNFKKSDDK